MGEPTKRILSLGGGTQSSALLLMSCDGVLPKLDAAIFADTQHEMPETYTYLDFLAEKAGVAGIEFLRVTAGDLKAETIARAGRGSQPSLPVRVLKPNGKLARINGYTCSYDFKRRQVTRYAKKVCGGRGAWKRATVEQWIGYTKDEVGRVKQSDECRCGHKRLRRLTKKEREERGDGALVELIHATTTGCSRCACTEFSPWQVNTWPLIDLGFTRDDASKWIVDQGYPEPPRSACYFCPNRGDAHWRYLKTERPELFASAVELDEFVRHGLNGLDGQGFLHQSGAPLAQADLRPPVEKLRDQGIEPLFLDEVDTDCDAGVCFT